MKTWRLLKLESHDAFMNMAIDEAILRSRISEEVPDTLRFYRWTPSAVSIGRFQKIENEVNLDECRKSGVDVVRRISGGGCVYHEAKSEITYSVIANSKDMGTKDVTEVYSRIYSAISEALRVIGLSTDYNSGDIKNCPNLTIGGKKISGSAQANKKSIVLQHGTLLLDVDLPKMFTYLKVPWTDDRIQIVKKVKHKITSLHDELGHYISPETVINAIAHGFQVTLNIQVVENVQSLETELTAKEKEIALRLYKEKYSKKEWNFNGKSNLG